MANFSVNAVIKAIDDFSIPIQKMERAASSFGTKAEESFAKAERRLNRLGEKSLKVGRSFGIAGIAILTPLALATQQAVEFEDKMADVAKVANVTLGSKEFDKLSTSAKKLAIELGVSAEQSAALQANLAQGGVGLQDLDRVSLIAGRVGVAFGITSDIAGESFVKIQNALGGTIEETQSLMDSINLLGNTMSASSPEILTFMKNGGAGVTRATGASSKAVAAMGAQLIAMGKSAEESATIMQRFTKQSLMNKDLRKVFDDAGGGHAGMMKILQTGMQKTGKEQDKYFQQFGDYGLSIRLLGENYTQLEKAIDISTDKTKALNSVNQEFENRTQTSAFALAQAKTQFNILAIEIGSKMLPIINDLLKVLTPIIDRVISWSNNNKELSSSLIKGVALVGGLSLAISGVAYVMAGLSKLTWLLRGALLAYNIVVGISTFMLNGSIFALRGNIAAQYAYIGVMKLATAANWLFNASNPVGWIIILIGLVAVMIKYWDEWGAALSAFIPVLGHIVSLFMTFKKNWDLIKKSFEVNGIIGGLKAIGITILDAFLMPIQQLLELIGQLPDWLGGGLAVDASSAIADLRKGLQTELEATAVSDQRPAINSEKVRQDTMVSKMESSQKQTVDVNFNNTPKGTGVFSSGNIFMTPTINPAL